MKAVFWLGIHDVFNANISFTFQAIKNLYAHFTYVCFGPFSNFFWCFLGIVGDK